MIGAGPGQPHSGFGQRSKRCSHCIIAPQLLHGKVRDPIALHSRQRCSAFELILCALEQIQSADSPICLKTLPIRLLRNDGVPQPQTENDGSSFYAPDGSATSSEKTANRKLNKLLRHKSSLKASYSTSGCCLSCSNYEISMQK